MDEALKNRDDWGGGPLPEAKVIARSPAKMLVQWQWAGEEQGGDGKSENDSREIRL